MVNSAFLAVGRRGWSVAVALVKRERNGVIVVVVDVEWIGGHV